MLRITVGKRLLQFIPVFIGVTLILFVLQNVVPGDPADSARRREGPDACRRAVQIRAADHLVKVNDEGQPVNAQGEATTELSRGGSREHVGPLLLLPAATCSRRHFG